MIEHCTNPIIDSDYEIYTMEHVGKKCPINMENEEDDFADIESYGEWINAVVGCDVLSEDIQPNGSVIDSINDFSVFFTDCTTSQKL